MTPTQPPANEVPTPRTDRFAIQSGRLIAKMAYGDLSLLETAVELQKAINTQVESLERDNIALRAALVKIANGTYRDGTYRGFKLDYVQLRDIARAAVPDWGKE